MTVIQQNNYLLIDNYKTLYNQLEGIYYTYKMLTIYQKDNYVSLKDIQYDQILQGIKE